MNDSTPCTHCRGTVAPDGFCWDCGTEQPAYRARLEASVAHGGGAAGLSDRGHRRAVNADAMALARTHDRTIAVVCDGVSLSARADRAARVAADTAAAALVAGLDQGALPETALADAVTRAHQAVSALARTTGPAQDRELAVAPACTIVAGVVGPDGVWCAWVGDSRAYWLPDDGPVVPLTEDDSGRDEALAAWLGADAGAVSPREGSRRGEGRLLLCTDGLWRAFPEAGALRVLAGGGLADGVRALVGRALEVDGTDNVTAVLMAGRAEFKRGT